MRVAIHTLGTRGDVQPYVALALGLKAEGHEVLVAAPSQYEAFVGTRGIDFAHLPGEFLELLESDEAKAAIAGSGGFGAGFKMLKRFKPIGRKQLSAEWAAARRWAPDLIIYHPKALGAPHIAERLRCPAVLASPLPGFTPTRDFASPLLPYETLGPLNRLTHSLMANSGDALFKGMIRQWRVKELDLAARPTRRLSPEATLYAYSSHVVPRPADWPPNVAVTGYWFLDDERSWTPDDSLRDFLRSGKPPLYVGFGSMPGIDPSAMTRATIAALDAAGERGVLAAGGGALERTAAGFNIAFIDGAPHDRLFPLMSACVHHGGAGTTAAALRAGKPSIVIPFFGDQPFWARRIERLRAGVALGPRKDLTGERLAAAIRQVTSNSGFRAKAEAIGSSIRAEDGVGSAIRFLNSRGLLKAGQSTGIERA